MEQIAPGTDAPAIAADLGPASGRKAGAAVAVTVVVDCDDDRHYDVLARLFAADPGFRLLVAAGRGVPGTPDDRRTSATPSDEAALAALRRSGCTHVAFVRHRFITPAHVAELLARLAEGKEATAVLVPGVNTFLTVGRAVLIVRDLERRAGRAAPVAAAPVELATLPEPEPRRLVAPLSVADTLGREGIDPESVAFDLGDRALQKQFFIEELDRHFPLPVNISLVLSNQCNLSCVMCPYHSPEALRTRQVDYFDHKLWLPLTLVEKLVAELKTAPSQHVPFSFHMGELDEPLLHPQITDIVRLLTSIPGAIVHITTNATLLTEERSRQLIEAGVQSVSFSVDAHSQDTYKAIRGAKLARTQRNVEGFLRLRQELNPGLSVNLCIIDQEPASTEIEDFKNHWRERGVSSVSVYQLFSPEPDGIYWNLTDRVFREQTRSPCRAVWEQVFVYPGGEVSLCCTTLVRVPQDGMVSMGNLNGSSLRDIWQGVPYQRVRGDLIDEDFSERPYCRDCGIWSQTYQFENVLTDGTKLITSETMEYFLFPDHDLKAIAGELAVGVRSGAIRGIWGIGSDFGRMVRLHPELPAALEAGGVALFDHERAGHTFNGLPIRSSAEIAGFDGGICLTPSSPASRGSMASHAHALGLPPDRLIDPYAARR
ncbi:radical SAM protein [Azospirillum sp. sgz302134]